MMCDTQIIHLLPICSLQLYRKLVQIYSTRILIIHTHQKLKISSHNQYVLQKQTKEKNKRKKLYK